MLRTRYLYDRYIIKREYIGDALQDGEWSLKEMYSQGQGGKKKAIYGLTKVVAEGCWYNESHNKEVMMLQAAMRVSYTSPKVMHWITKLLTWLTDCYLGRIAEGWIYEDFVNNIAKEPIIEFLNDEKNFYLGVSTPHIVLNYGNKIKVLTLTLSFATLLNIGILAILQKVVLLVGTTKV